MRMFLLAGLINVNLQINVGVAMMLMFPSPMQG